MKLRTLDQMHISSVAPNTLPPGREFDVSDALGSELLKKHPDKVEMIGQTADTASADAARIADQPVGTLKIADAEKAEAPHPNKAQKAAPANKAASSRKSKGN